MDKDQNRASIFGYGSLILPTSLVSRFTNLETSVDEIYENESRLENGNLTRDEAEKAWKDLKQDISLLPIKIPGFRRSYYNESHRGGAMLGIQPTRDNLEDYQRPLEYRESEDFINGIAVMGLEEDQKEKISQTEENYQTIQIHRDNIEHYLDHETLEKKGFELPKHIEVYVPEDEADKFDKETNRTRNQTYHARIMKGIEMIGEIYGKNVAQNFYEDFLDSTYERNFLTDEEWVKTSYNDSIEYLFEEIINDKTEE